MRKASILMLLAAFSTILLLSHPPHAHANQFKITGTLDVYFSPDGGTTTAIVNELNSAKSEILIQAYSFTSVPMAKARAMGYRNNKYLWQIKTQLADMSLCTYPH